jgi:tryptophan synthase alpha chain
MNRFDKLYQNKNKGILNIYTTIGFPSMEATRDIILSLADSGVDIIELGIPYSDPLADGPVIQQASSVAIQNGFNLKDMFVLIKEVRKHTQIPIVLMGYLNPLLQYGMDAFLISCQDVGVDALIIPDLPPEIYALSYQQLFRERGIGIAFLITPNTSEERIYKMDELSDSFIYMVSSSAITGGKLSIDQQKEAYFKRILSMSLSTPRLIGFGIHDRRTVQQAFTFANGAIIGSAFIQHIEKNAHQSISERVQQFIEQIGEGHRIGDRVQTTK